jgi:hypothetical protein
MKFTVEVGETEKIKIEFSRNWITGAMNTMADGVRVAYEDPFAASTHFSTRSKRRYTFTVGRVEKHDVAVEKERQFLLAALRPQTYRVFVDGVLRHQQSGY